jgi:hypothetical protein
MLPLGADAPVPFRPSCMSPLMAPLLLVPSLLFFFYNRGGGGELLLYTATVYLTTPSMLFLFPSSQKGLSLLSNAHAQNSFNTPCYARSPPQGLRPP